MTARYKDFEAVLPAARVLRYPNEVLKIDLAHKWGIAPMHYHAKLYHFALDEIKAMSGA